MAGITTPANGTEWSGPAHGVSARGSAALYRALRFVETRADYDAARAAIDNQRSAEETLRELDRLGRGHLSFVIIDSRIREDVTHADGRREDVFDWITFRGEACVPN